LLGRAPASDFRVVVRCWDGAPAVIENGPIDREGRPFPTRYWMVCPALAAAVSRLEASGGVKRLENDPAGLTALVLAHRRHRRLTGRGVGGNASLVRAKCLHAQLAFSLVEGGSAVGEWISARLEPIHAHELVVPAESVGG
jgi:hypothetical protein